MTGTRGGGVFEGGPGGVISEMFKISVGSKTEESLYLGVFVREENAACLIFVSTLFFFFRFPLLLELEPGPFTRSYILLPA